MTSCRSVQELFESLLEGALDPAAASSVREHVRGCSECAELLATVEAIAEAIAPWRSVEPPAQLVGELQSSPCRRWLGLLFRAVDHELEDVNLARLLEHLEVCGACREVWNDLALVHQVGDSLQPPPALLARCLAPRRSLRGAPVLSRRAVTVAAYLLAVVASLALGNPVTLARHEQTTEAVQSLASTVTSGVGEVAASGTAELKVMLWRVWRWGSRQLDGVQQALRSEQSDDLKPDSDQGGST